MFTQKLAHFRAVAVSAVLSSPFVVFAQAAGDPFTDALTEATTKVTSYAGALVGLGAVAVIFMIGLKYVKKLPRAA